MIRRAIPIFLILLSALAVQAQTTAFTYQGKLTDTGSPANAQYDMIFRLFSAANGGTQIGSDVSLLAVTATNGTFTVELDFGSNAFPGNQDRYLEISVRDAAPLPGPAYVTLSPRQHVTNSPFAIRALNTNLADGLSSACALCVTDANIGSVDGSKVSGTVTNSNQLGGVSAGQYVLTTDSRLSDARAPTAGSTNYIQNTASVQSSSNFNISGNGVVGGTLSANAVNANSIDRPTAGTINVGQTTATAVLVTPATTFSNPITLNSASNAAGNLRFSAANPYVVASSYMIIPGGAYFSNLGTYFEGQAQFRGGVHNDNNAFLTLAGGTSGINYVPGTLGIGTSSPSDVLHVVGTGTAITASDGAVSTRFFSSSATGKGYVGTSTNHPLVVRTNSVDRVTIDTSGVVGVSGRLSASSSSASNGVIAAANTDANGTGLVASGNNLAGAVLAAGSGLSATGTVTGVYAKSTTSGAGQALYSEQFGSVVRVNYWDGATQYKINGAGTVSTVVKDQNSQQRVMFAPEAPEVLFEDYGTGQLVNGRARIDLEPALSANLTVNERHPLRVFIQLEGDCNGVYVTNKSGAGFDVVELMNGRSNVAFSWHIVGNRADEELPVAPSQAGAVQQKRISHYADLRLPVQADNANVRSSAVQGTGQRP